VFDEVEGEAAEPIPVGNGNLLDTSAHGPVQNGEQTGTLPVDPRRDVRDDLVVGIRHFEVLHLSFEVVLLLLARDSCVADPRSALGRFLPLCCAGPVSLEGADDV
jgi:hypothetical protein